MTIRGVLQSSHNVSAPACTMREIVDGIADALGKHPFPVRVPATPALLLNGICPGYQTVAWRASIKL